ncbi:MAG: hypothetical protein QOG66_2921 [Methylobacteriaceae bacterium]|jgi:hypothetical protein|nr:hypothetical protein [Methylobacteriaceae bacterium]
MLPRLLIKSLRNKLTGAAHEYWAGPSMCCLLAASAVVVSTIAPAETERALMSKFAASVTPRMSGITARNDFRTEAEANSHCRGTAVVWVIAREHVYFTKADPEYGTKGEGAYMCENDARGDRNRAARNGAEAPQ